MNTCCILARLDSSRGHERGPLTSFIQCAVCVILRMSCFPRSISTYDPFGIDVGLPSVVPVSRDTHSVHSHNSRRSEKKGEHTCA